MTHSEVVETVNKILVEEFEIDEAALTPHAHLYEELRLDSLDAVDLVAALEREFGVKIERQEHEETVRSIRTLEEVYNFVLRVVGE